MADSTDNCLEWMLSWCFWLLSCHWKCGESRIKSGNETRFLKALQRHICHPLHSVFQLILAGLLSMQPTKRFPWPPALPPQLASEQLSAGLWPNKLGTAEQWHTGWDYGSRGWQMQSLGDKHKSLVAHPLDLSATILQKVRNTWIIYLLWLSRNCSKTASYKIKTNLALFTFSKFKYGSQ